MHESLPCSQTEGITVACVDNIQAGLKPVLTEEKMNRKFRFMTGILAVPACVTAVHAQQIPRLPDKYPNKPIRIVVATSSGGGTDFTTRLVAGYLSERWGHPFVIDNRGGASGVIAAELVAKATADGYTLLGTPSSVLVNIPLLGKVTYDVKRDFAPVSRLTSASYLLAVTASLPVSSVKELISYTKSKPGGISYASSGIGTSAHLASELFKSVTGANMVHVPYKGTGPALTDLIGGHVQAQFGGVTSMIPLAKSGKLKALGVTSLKRSRLLPDLPTVAESGYPGFEVTGWYSIMAPAGTPAAIVLALNREITRILNMPEIQEKFATDGAETVPGTPTQFRDAFAKEIDKWTKVIKEANLKL